MANIGPVSDLRNNTFLYQVEVGSSGYLTVNGRGRYRYTSRESVEGEKFETIKSMLRLICELNEGRRSGEEEGYVLADDVRAYFHGKSL